MFRDGKLKKMKIELGGTLAMGARKMK